MPVDAAIDLHHVVIVISKLFVCHSDQCANECTGPDMVNQACIYTGTTTWRCECATGWQDFSPDVDDTLACTRSLDNCQNRGVDVCRNGASCVDMDNTFMCICTDAYTGPTCEELYDPCSAPVCINGGSCTMYVTRGVRCSV